MEITRIINNNCVATEINNEEAILTGAGIGFQQKVGNSIDDDKIEKVFKLEKEEMVRLEDALARVPIEFFHISQDIIEYGTAMLGQEISPQIIIGLVDHVYFSIERKNKGQTMPPMFAQEMQLIYPREFAVGTWAIQHIADELTVVLEPSEAAFITMHILNGIDENQDKYVQKTVYFVQKIIEIIEKSMDITIPRNMIGYSRLSLHLKFLADRVFKSKATENEKKKLSIGKSLSYVRLIAPKYQVVNIAIQAITQFIQKQFDHTLEKEEKLYLTVHLMRLLDEMAENK